MRRPCTQEVPPERREAWLQDFDSLPRERPTRFEAAFLPLYIAGAIIVLVVIALELLR